MTHVHMVFCKTAGQIGLARAVGAYESRFAAQLRVDELEAADHVAYVETFKVVPFDGDRAQAERIAYQEAKRG